MNIYKEYKKYKDELKNSNNTLYLLLFNDTIERLDTLLLELRHLQQNIIYLLKAPDLNLPLRFEEDFIWFGVNKCKFYNNQDLIESILNEDIDIMIRAWIIPYKNKESSTSWDSEKVDNFFTDKLRNKHHQEIKGKIESDMESLFNGVWSTDQRGHFHNLRFLQELKRNIVLDKLLLCKQSLNSICNEKLDKDELARFVLFRTAIIVNTNEYVKKLSNQQTLFSHHFDFSPVQHPHPSINRRREQHMYTVHLDEQCHDLYKELNSYIRSIEDKPNKLLRNTPIFHRWQQNTLSQSFSFYSEFSSKEENSNTTYGVHNINSSYWMPERPDIQAIIAHEVSHILVRENYDDLAFHTLDKLNDPFSNLIKSLKQCIDLFSGEDKESTISWKEIIVDILATTIKGHSFLYALLLELLGLELEMVFYTGVTGDKINLNLINNKNIFESYLKPKNANHEGFYRIKIVCKWLSLITPNPSFLEKKLVIDCEDIVNNLYGYIHSKTHQFENTYPYWIEVTNRLCITLGNSKVLIKNTRYWLESRKDDKNIRRYALPLPDEVRVDCISTFKDKFSPLFEEEENYLNDEKIFKYSNDIPWQSSIITSFLLNKKENRKLEFINCINSHSLYSRGIYDLALEFHIHYTEAPQRKLMRCFAIVKDTFNKKCFNFDKYPVFENIETLLFQKEDSRTEKEQIKYEKDIANNIEELRCFLSEQNVLIDIQDYINNNGYESILESLKNSTKKKSLPSPILLYKICLSGSEKNHPSLPSTWVDHKNDNNDKIDYYTGILNIFDIFYIQNNPPIYRTLLPSFSHKNKSNLENFPSFFTIQERAYPIFFTKNFSFKSLYKINIMASISITVKRAAARIDLAQRIIRVAKLNDKNNKNPKSISDLGGYFNCKNADIMFLCEGKNDLLLVFGFPVKQDHTERLEEFFKIQECLYKDFQISKTETIFTTECFKIAMGNTKFSTEIRISLLEDRLSNGEKNSYVNDVRVGLNKIIKGKFTITKITGRMDFSIIFNTISGHHNIYNAIMKIVNNKYVDRVSTYIGLYFT